MQIIDFTPPSNPSPAEQRDALQKGLGRAKQWAMIDALKDKPLLDACLTDQRYDQELEESRGPWLWSMIQATEVTAQFRKPILQALSAFDDEHSMLQLCELAYQYAKSGDEAFRAKLYEMVEQKPIAEDPLLGIEEILRLDGDQGFLFIVGVHGQELLNREWEDADYLLVVDAIEILGQGQVKSLLVQANNANVRRFEQQRAIAEKKHSKRRRPPSLSKQMESITVQEIITKAEQRSGALGLFRSWGKQANAYDLKTIFQRLLQATDAQVLANYLRIFSARAFPEIDERLLALIDHPEERVRRAAFSALEMNCHSAVRALGLRELEKGVRLGSIVSLFINNYYQGDEALLFDAIELPDSQDDLHWLFWHILNLLQKNPQADSSQLALAAYALTPCGQCRSRAAEQLFEQQVAPVWLMQECQYDSVEFCRELATVDAEDLHNEKN